jgi:acetyltransferase-like isoleucine patch superfamily enzyme
VRREVERRVAAEVRRALDERLPEIEARVAADARDRALAEPLIFGPPERVHLAGSAIVNDALLNTVSGSLTVAADAFFGHRVCVLTGTHDVTRRGRERQLAIPDAGRDIHIGEGAWVGSGAIVLGPCRIGAHAVVAAGAVVTGDVAPATVVAGVPARVVRVLE